MSFGVGQWVVSGWGGGCWAMILTICAEHRPNESPGLPKHRGTKRTMERISPESKTPEKILSDDLAGDLKQKANRAIGMKAKGTRLEQGR